MTVPRDIDAGLRDQLHEHFTPAEIVELTLDVVAWNKQKVTVALGTDRPLSEAGLTALTFDAAGRSVTGEPAGLGV